MTNNSKLLKSTLLNETGNVELYRVSEETKIKVAEETKRIQDKMTLLNASSRRRFKREENNKIRMNEQNRNQMIGRWDIKTKNSPFRVNQLQKEENRLERLENMQYRKEMEDFKNKTIDSMIGTRKFDVCSNETVGIFKDEAVHLALALRKQTDDRQIVHRERSTLDQMLDMEYAQMRHKFPSLGFTVSDRELSRAGSSSNSSTDSLFRNKFKSVGSRGKHQGGSEDGHSKLSRADTYSSMESGSGSVYKPPNLDPAPFVKTLDVQFSR